MLHPDDQDELVVLPICAGFEHFLRCAIEQLLDQHQISLPGDTFQQSVFQRPVMPVVRGLMIPQAAVAHLSGKLCCAIARMYLCRQVPVIESPHHSCAPEWHVALHWLLCQQCPAVGAGPVDSPVHMGHLHNVWLHSAPRSGTALQQAIPDLRSLRGMGYDLFSFVEQVCLEAAVASWWVAQLDYRSLWGKQLVMLVCDSQHDVVDGCLITGTCNAVHVSCGASQF